MKRHSEIPLVPYNFARCFNDSCTKAGQCLHRMAATNDTAQHPTIPIINPRCIPEDTGACKYFKSTQKMRVAWGIQHLLDTVPHKDARSIKAQLIAHFGKTKYYRIYREENFLTPEEQEYIRRLFHKYGVEQEPAFESYSDEYRW
ncbi:DUF6078 family protein [Bacteroides sp. UBA939]|uniref:DUF6078 family protein n=1 Tax=Bacteroides sp. UBA939 TaxID=1946092 RepID=UPI0025C51B66|nr:DUF6078 family protein [Bacteroides sp. UBA939]